MPEKPYKNCRHPGCPELTREKYCHKHKQYERAIINQYEQRYAENRDPFYSTARWQKARNYYAAKHPLCEDCLQEGKTVLMDVVDHIIEIKDGGARLKESNFRSLCRKCHDIKTAKRKRERRA